MTYDDQGTKHFYCHDANFNITLALDSSGNPVERYHYSPYGEVKFLDTNFDEQSGSTIGNEYLYTGRRLDPETGLQLNRNRFYASHLGRWVNRDPIVSVLQNDPGRKTALEEIRDRMYENLWAKARPYLVEDFIQNDRDFQVLSNVYLPVDVTLEYADGMSLYGAHFVPNMLDPSGTRTDCVGVTAWFFFFSGSKSKCSDTCGNSRTVTCFGAGVGVGGGVGVSVSVTTGCLPPPGCKCDQVHIQVDHPAGVGGDVIIGNIGPGGNPGCLGSGGGISGGLGGGASIHMETCTVE